MAKVKKVQQSNLNDNPKILYTKFNIYKISTPFFIFPLHFTCHR
jgi:hypothetical protein